MFMDIQTYKFICFLVFVCGWWMLFYIASTRLIQISLPHRIESLSGKSLSLYIYVCIERENEWNSLYLGVYGYSDIYIYKSVVLTSFVIDEWCFTFYRYHCHTGSNPSQADSECVNILLSVWIFFWVCEYLFGLVLNHWFLTGL